MEVGQFATALYTTTRGIGLRFAAGQCSLFILELRRSSRVVNQMIAGLRAVAVRPARGRSGPAEWTSTVDDDVARRGDAKFVTFRHR